MHVGVGDDDQAGVRYLADGLQLMGIPFPNPLFARPASVRKPRRLEVPEFAAFQEPSHEGIRLRVLAEQDDADSAHSLSQPRATVSDSEMPSTVRSGRSLTRTGPFPSLWNHLPFAPAM